MKYSFVGKQSRVYWGLFLALAVLPPSFVFAADTVEEKDTVRFKELDAYWEIVSQSVAAGDFSAYKATFHADAVFVSGIAPTSYPITEALAKWQSGFQDTKQGKLQAKVEFRFSQRMGDATTAHESGIFHYTTQVASGETTSAFIHFEALLVKKDGRWVAMMEYQKSKATEEQWLALGK